MAYSFVLYDGDGTTDTFTVPFGFIKRADVDVKVAGSSVGFSWLSDTQVQLDSAPASGTDNVRVERTTNRNNREVDFSNAATLTKTDLDNSALQMFYLAQEALDTADEDAQFADADTVDGEHASAFADASHTHTESEITDLGNYLTDITGEPAGDLSDVVVSSVGNGEVLVYDNGTGNWINQTLAEAGIAATGHTHTESDITDLGNYAVVGHSHATSDVTSGTFADARIAESNVTQHEGALTVTESQISDLGSYLTDITAEPISDLSDVVITTVGDGEILTWDNANSQWINQTLSEAGIAPSSHTSDTSNPHSVTASQVGNTTAQWNANQINGVDVDTSGLADNKILKYNSGTGKFEIDDDVASDGSDTDHGTLSGLGDDDHTHYVHNDTARTITAVHTFNPSAAGAPFSLGANATGQLVTGFNADQLDGNDASAFANSSHTHAAGDIDSGTLADARVAQSNVTQHEGALTITESQISDLGSYLTDITSEAIGDLSDVVISTPADNEVLAYNSGTGEWQNQTPAEAGLASNSHSHTLSDLNNVTVSTPADDEVLAYDNGTGDWINQTPAEAGLASASHTHAAGDVTSGTFADARVAESNVTQHQAAIDHNTLTNYNVAEHRTINDAGIGTTDLWSADKIQSELNSAGSNDHIILRDEKASGTNGGTLTNGDWRTRDLNTEVLDEPNAASLSSNQITLDSGTYAAWITCPAHSVGQNRARLQNITDGITLLLGTSEDAGTANQTLRGAIVGHFTLSAQKVLEVQQQAENSQSDVGFGIASGFATEVYTVVHLRKVN